MSDGNDGPASKRDAEGAQATAVRPALTSLLGRGLERILTAFFQLDSASLDRLLTSYGHLHGAAAEDYARAMYPKWQSGAIRLHGKTMLRLVELVPPRLGSAQRLEILQDIIAQHRTQAAAREEVVRINVHDPAAGFARVSELLDGIRHDADLAFLPQACLQAASWLYDDDITAARAMAAEVLKREADMARASASQELELLRQAIQSGTVRSASYQLDTPALRLHVVAYSRFGCFVATACHGANAPEVQVLRAWRDAWLVRRGWGRRFVVWYYQHGATLAAFLLRHGFARMLVSLLISAFVRLLPYRSRDL